MSALPGGAADKMGNRYEDWWTLWRLADLLQGRATRIRVEPPGVAGSGAEFWIDDPEGRWFEQVKNETRNWTIQRLLTDGVLTLLLRHLQDGHRVRLVTSSAAGGLADLSARARAAADLPEYEEILNQTQGRDFERLAKGWGVAADQAWEFVSRVYVEHRPVELLRDAVHLRYELLLQGDPGLAINGLRGWLDEVLHDEVTAPGVWSHLAAVGIKRRLLAGDPGTLEALEATVARNQRRVESMRAPIDMVPHPLADRLVSDLVAPDSKQLVVLHGKAGSGKSVIANAVVQQLASRGWFASVVRMDASAATSQSAKRLGEDFGLEGSPAVVLASVADGSPALLVVDQLDAVSTYSGRIPDSFEAVAELISQALSVPNLKVVLVVRTVDMEADPRMRAILSDDSTAEAVEVTDLGLDEVKTLLTRLGVPTPGLADATLELLRVPLHLAIFSRLSVQSQLLGYRRLADLYERFTDELRHEIEHNVGHLDWTGITGSLVGYMSDGERLTAPQAALDGASRAEVTALVSRGVLTTEADRVAFFHETYFDFLFARAFVSAGENLHDFVSRSGQYLFRRAQTRQILEYLAAVDRPAFRSTVVDLLTSDSVRTHLRDVVVTVLRGLDAMADDWLVLEPIAFSDHRLAAKVAGLLSTPIWFDAADAAGRWETLLSNPETAALSAHQLLAVARERPERVAALIRPHIGSSEEWRLRLRAMVQWSLTPGLVDIAIELIERGDLDDARGPIAVNSDFWSIIYGLREDDPNGAARMIGAHLQRALARTRTSVAVDPFEAGYLPDSSSGGDSLIFDVATAAPKTFVEAVLPFVIAVGHASARPAIPGSLRHARWGLRYIDSYLGVSHAIYAGTEEALRSISRERPERVAELVSTLAATDIDELRFLVCQAYEAAGVGDLAIDWLTSDLRNLELGYGDSIRSASRALIASATQTADDDRIVTLGDALLSFYPPWELTAESLGRRGWAQYELLSAVEPSRRSIAVGRRIAEWERKFAGDRPAVPRAIEAHFVGPPIRQDSAEHMSDAAWRGAIGRYQADQTDWSGDLPVGGARELAQLLGSRAELEPLRFAEFALTLGTGTPAAYFQHIVDAVAGKVSIDLLTRVCLHAREVAGQELGRSLCRAVEVVHMEAGGELIDLVASCAQDDDPDHESARTESSSGEFFWGGDLVMAGMNCTRGAAARTLALLLFGRKDLINRLLPSVSALADDPILAVRTAAADAIGAVMNVDPAGGLDLVEVLLDAPTDVFDSDAVCRLLLYAISRDPSRFASQLIRALGAPASIAGRAGHVWVVAYINDLLVDPLPTELGNLSIAARRGAARTLASDPSVATDLVVQLLDDDDADVREAAAGAMRKIDSVSAAIASLLTASFVSSESFDAHFDDLFFALDRSRSLLPTATMAACARAVDIGNVEFGDIRTSRAGMGVHVINVILRLYRQGDQTTRTSCLDLIDTMVEAGAYGLDQALEDER